MNQIIKEYSVFHGKFTSIWTKEPGFKSSSDSATFYSNEHIYQRELVLMSVLTSLVNSELTPSSN